MDIVRLSESSIPEFLGSCHVTVFDQESGTLLWHALMSWKPPSCYKGQLGPTWLSGPLQAMYLRGVLPKALRGVPRAEGGASPGCGSLTFSTSLTSGALKFSLLFIYNFVNSETLQYFFLPLGRVQY